MKKFKVLTKLFTHYTVFSHPVHIKSTSRVETWQILKKTLLPPPFLGLCLYICASFYLVVICLDLQEAAYEILITMCYQEYVPCLLTSSVCVCESMRVHLGARALPANDHCFWDLLPFLSFYSCPFSFSCPSHLPNLHTGSKTSLCHLAGVNWILSSLQAFVDSFLKIYFLILFQRLWSNEGFVHGQWDPPNPTQYYHLYCIFPSLVLLLSHVVTSVSLPFVSLIECMCWCVGCRWPLCYCEQKPWVSVQRIVDFYMAYSAEDWFWKNASSCDSEFLSEIMDNHWGGMGRQITFQSNV